MCVHGSSAITVQLEHNQYNFGSTKWCVLQIRTILYIKTVVIISQIVLFLCTQMYFISNNSLYLLSIKSQYKGYLGQGRILVALFINILVGPDLCQNITTTRNGISLYCSQMLLCYYLSVFYVLYKQYG